MVHLWLDAKNAAGDDICLNIGLIECVLPTADKSVIRVCYAKTEILVEMTMKEFSKALDKFFKS